MKSICVYCGSADAIGSEYLEAARQMGTILARRKLGLVYGGGRTGLMGALADAVLATGVLHNSNTSEQACIGVSGRAKYTNRIIRTQSYLSKMKLR